MSGFHVGAREIFDGKISRRKAGGWLHSEIRADTRVTIFKFMTLASEFPVRARRAHAA